MLGDPTARRQAGRYVVVGMLGYCVQVASFALLLHVIDVPYGVAGLLAGLLALVNNFLSNRHWTFEDAHGHVGRQAASYMVISAVFFAAQLALLHLLVGLELAKVLAEALSIVLVVPVNFLAQRRFSFRA
jgi:putative flippase GtrA